MSYKSREKKRRYKAAQAAKQKAAAKQSEGYPERHYLTIVSRACCCNRCGASLRDGRECVYRNTPREILCLDCASREQVRYRLSRRWERKNSKRKDGRLVPAARKT